MPAGDETDIDIISLPSVDRYHLLVIGIEYYAGFARLPNAVKDAAELADYLTDKYRFHRPDEYDDLRDVDDNYKKPEFKNPLPEFQSVQTTCLFNKKATKSNISGKLNEFAGLKGNNKLGENDALLIYFAGHGIYKNNTYYLIVQDSDINDVETFISVDDIATRFKQYPLQKHSRHVLLILDSCYAGGANLGITNADASLGIFTGQVLTSCSPQQPADDGIIYNGSAFARSLTAVLKENQATKISIDELFIAQEKKFVPDIEKTSEFQTIELAYLPGALSGSGTFLFQRKQIERPDIVHLRESIIEHLDFLDQRNDVQRYYNDAINRLNVIITRSDNLRAHQLISKIAFKWLNETEGITFLPGLCSAPAPINLDLHGDTEIFEILNKGIKTADTEYNPEDVLKWFLDQMITTNTAWYNKKHVILRIDFKGSSDTRFRQIEKFCTDFSALFLDYFERLPEKEKPQYGKMFVLISDVSTNTLDSHAATFSTIVKNSKYNFIPIRKNGSINSNHVKTWLTEFSKKNQTEKIKRLREANAFKTWIGQSEYEYEKFIEKFCSYCEFTQEEIDTLNAELYDYNEKFFI